MNKQIDITNVVLTTDRLNLFSRTFHPRHNHHNLTKKLNQSIWALFS